MTNGIVYLLTHMQLAARLVVSVYSLRKWYDGSVTVFTTRPESHEIGRLMAADDRLRVEHRAVNEVIANEPYTAAYLTKASLLCESPFEATVFLDADTLISGPLDELLHCAQTSPLTVTVFGEFSTTRGPGNGVWPKWRNILTNLADAKDWFALLDYAERHSLPLINTGVFAAQRDAPFVTEWRELAIVGRETPTPDESALQLLLLKYPHQLLGSQFNCIPHMVQNSRDVRIWHFAVASHLLTPFARSLWLPVYEECCQLNLASIATWSRIAIPSASADCGN